MGHLSFQEVRTGVIYGFLKDIGLLQAEFGVDSIAFCFDSRSSKRKEVLPGYKRTRHNQEHSPDEQKARDELFQQINKLRDQYLPKIGFKNIFYREGYESDDIIASLCDALQKDDEAVVVSADKDLYQLLSAQVSLYNPKKHKLYTLQSFFKDYGIPAHRWPKVLAIAGCHTDEIPGIPGVGEKTAIKFLRGELKADSQKSKAIQENWSLVMKNRRLVCLPFEGVGTFEWSEDQVSQSGWEEVVKELGIKSLRERAPWGAPRKRSNAGFFPT